jgi:DNA-directed RNA polymerase subunit RPC12/RpoP
MASLVELSKKELVAIILDLRNRVEALEAEVARLRKNSSNSSKPPSSDIVKPPQPPVPVGRRKRRIGGQPGHPRHDREAFAPEQIDQTLSYTLDRCPDCGGRLQRLRDQDRVIQQVEMVSKPVQRTEHQARTYRCTHCGKLTPSDPATRNYAQCLLDALRQMFRVIHRREQMTPARFQQVLERARQRVLKVGRLAPARREARNLAGRFRKQGAAYFRFITTPGMEPTNNLAEQAIRFVVIDRRITQGTRSETGRHWNERIWTTVATLTQQDRSIFAYLRDALHTYLNNQPIAALLPAGP